MRKMASIQRIAEIRPIENADNLEHYRINGWWVVDRKGAYVEGQPVVFCEVDAFVPNAIAPFLSKGKEPREYNGVKGERLKTVKLRGALSQGLLLPCNVGIGGFLWLNNTTGDLVVLQDGDDVSEILGIQKWEPPVDVSLRGNVKGNFPHEIHKTDQERIQNLGKELQQSHAEQWEYEVSEKLDGSSCTMFIDVDGNFRVCSRNLELKEDEGNAFWRAARKYKIEEKMRDALLNGFALQGELIGPKIQGNPYKLNDVDFLVFDVYDIANQEYIPPEGRRDLVNNTGLKHVPVWLFHVTAGGSIEDLLKLAEGASMLHQDVLREGLVFKRTDGKFSFKAISNKWLLKKKE